MRSKTGLKHFPKISEGLVRFLIEGNNIGAPLLHFQLNTNVQKWENRYRSTSRISKFVFLTSCPDHFIPDNFFPRVIITGRTSDYFAPPTPRLIQFSLHGASLRLHNLETESGCSYWISNFVFLKSCPDHFIPEKFLPKVIRTGRTSNNFAPPTPILIKFSLRGAPLRLHDLETHDWTHVAVTVRPASLF